MILALDPATKCGWAMLGDDDRVTSGVWDLSLDKGQPSGARFAQMRNALNIAHNEQAIERIAIERTQSLRGQAAAQVAHGLLGIIEEFAFRRDIPVAYVHASTLKKHIAGSGRAEKETVARIVRERFGITVPTTLDETDALAVLAWDLDEHAPIPTRKTKWHDVPNTEF